MNILVVFFALLAFVSTMAGGLFAIKYSDKRHLILGFSAGAVMGMCLFDLLPEALEISKKFHSPQIVLAAVAVGFGIYFAISNWINLSAHTEECKNIKHAGKLGAGSLSIHSVLDGIGMGLAFQVSPALGLMVTLGVIGHDFSDGINTANLILKNGGTNRQAFQWLLADAAAPIVGAISTLFFVLPGSVLGLLLALFAGFFLYIGASDLIPECHHNHPKHLTSVAVFGGMALMWILIHMAG